MGKRKELDEKTLHTIVSLYAQGSSLREIERQIKIHHGKVKNILKKVGLYREDVNGKIYQGICEVCHKTFVTSSPARKYCHDPCDWRYKPKTSERGMNYFYINVIRKEFWKQLNSNPEKALKLQQEMEKEEGKEFRDMILDGITETDEFKHLKSIQKKYKKFF